MLDQQEFTDLCRQKNFDVLIDIGHAHANSWDIKKLITGSPTGTLNFPEVLKHIRSEVPDADLIIEYTRPEYHGKPLEEDIKTLSLTCPTQYVSLRRTVQYLA